MDQNLLNYINQARNSGMSDEQIQTILHTAGWLEGDIQAALDENSKSSPNIPASQDSAKVVVQSMVTQTAATGEMKKVFPKKLVIIIGVVVVILAIVGAAGVKFGIIKMIADKIGIPKPPTSVVQEQTPAFAPVAQAVENSTSSMQNCGNTRDEIIANHLFGVPLSRPITANETISLKCMDVAIAHCAPAYIVSVNDKGKQAESRVLGTIDSACAISQEDFSGKYTTCRVPQSQIDGALSAMKTKDVQPGMIFSAFSVSIGLSGVGGTIKDSSGKPTQWDCAIPKPSVDIKVDDSQTNDSDGPVTISGLTNYFFLHWTTNPYTGSCSKFGSWAGSARTLWSGFSFGAKSDKQTYDLKKSFDVAGYTSTDPVSGEYTFGLACSNKTGNASDTIKVYIK